MDTGNLSKIKNSKRFKRIVFDGLAIEKLKAERDGVTEAFLREKENLIMYEKELEELKNEEEYLEETISEKQNNLKEIEMIIQESESNYSKVGGLFFVMKCGVLTR